MLLNQMDTKKWLILAMGWLLCLTLLVCFWPKPAKLVVVDMTRAIQKPALMLAHSKLTKDEQLKIMQRFSALLPKVISTYGQSHHLTIMSTTVLASHNNLDITDEIVALTIARMKHEA